MGPPVVGIWLSESLSRARARGGGAGALLSSQGNMRPEERKQRLEYLNRRFGLDKPLMVQYGRWLNSVSPVGFRIHSDDDVAVTSGSAKPREIDFRHPAFKWPDLGRSFV